MIGIIIAMSQELVPYNNHIFKKEQIFSKDFCFGKIGNKDIIISQSGIGKVNAAFTTTLMIERYNPDIIINTGVSGGLSKLNIADIIIADKVVQHDVDTSALGDPKGYISTVDKLYFHTSKRINSIALKNIKNVYSGTVACGDQFIADESRSKEILAEFNAIACDMESGAIAQVAEITNTEFAIIRAISDKAGTQAAGDFNSMLESVADRLYQAVKKVIKKL